MNGNTARPLKKALIFAIVAAASWLSVAARPAGAAPARGSIAGTVRNALTGAPVPGVEVAVFYWATNGSPSGDLVHGTGFLTDAQTAADGTYRIGLPPSGSRGYWVCFDTGLTGPYYFQCWADQSTSDEPFPDPFGFVQLPGGSTTIRLSPGQHVADIDGDLVPRLSPSNGPATGSLAGRVTVEGTKTGVGGVTVTAFNPAGVPVGHAVTGGGGTYVFGNLGPSAGDVLCVDATNAHIGPNPTALRDRCYVASPWRAGAPPPPDATPVPVAIGQATNGIDIALRPRPAS